MTDQAMQATPYDSDLQETLRQLERAQEQVWALRGIANYLTLKSHEYRQAHAGDDADIERTRQEIARAQLAAQEQARQDRITKRAQRGRDKQTNQRVKDEQRQTSRQIEQTLQANLDAHNAEIAKLVEQPAPAKPKDKRGTFERIEPPEPLTPMTDDELALSEQRANGLPHPPAHEQAIG